MLSGLSSLKPDKVMTLHLIFSFLEVQDFIERMIGSGYNEQAREEKSVYLIKRFSINQNQAKATEKQIKIGCKQLEKHLIICITDK